MAPKPFPPEKVWNKFIPAGRELKNRNLRDRLAKVVLDMELSEHLHLMDLTLERDTCRRKSCKYCEHGRVEFRNTEGFRSTRGS